MYGADATAGVVNFVLRDDFEGLDVNAQSGITEVGDGAESRLSVAIGKNFGDGNNVFLGLEVARRNEAQYAGRDFYENGWADPGTVGYGLINQSGLRGRNECAVAGGDQQPLSEPGARLRQPSEHVLLQHGWHSLAVAGRSELQRSLQHRYQDWAGRQRQRVSSIDSPPIR